MRRFRDRVTRSAYRRKCYGQADSAAIESTKSQEISVSILRRGRGLDSRLGVSLKDALAISSAYELGDKIKLLKKRQLNLAGSLKQTFMRRCKQTRAITYNTHKEHENEIMSGTVERSDAYLSILASIEAQLSEATRFLARSLIS